MNKKPNNQFEFGQVVGLKSGIKGKVVARNRMTGEFFLEYGKGGKIQSFTKNDVLQVEEGDGKE